MHLLSASTVLFVPIAVALCAAAAESPIPGDAEIRTILASRVGAQERGIGIVVGVIDPNGRRVVSYGGAAKGESRPLDGETVFEIGSITKVFTSLILMDMVQKGEVAVTDPVAKFLPAGVKVPERSGRQITLADLATQSSGIPRMPTNFKPKDMANPYVDYSPELLYAFLSELTLTRDIGSAFEYSNVGVGLLGHALSLRAGSDYETLVRARVLEPLGLKSTGVRFSPEMKARLAVGHGANLDPVANWDLDALAGAGALRSTANDLLAFLAANLGYSETALSGAMAAQVSIRRPAGAGGMEIAYNWLVQSKPNRNPIIWHNGGAGGYRSYIGFDPIARTGVVVLANYSSPAGPDDIGRHLLDETYPLANPTAPVEHTEITVEPTLLDHYVGIFQLGAAVTLSMTREGGQLYAQLTGQPRIAVYPEGDGKFFLKVVDAQLSFAKDAEGRVTQVVLHQNGRDQVAKRIEASRAAALAAALAKRVQEQTAAPGAEAALRRDIEELRVGQPKYELLSTALAELTRRQLPQLQATITRLGAIEAITLKRVDPSGADIFEVKFEHGLTEWRVAMESEEKIAAVGFRPM